MKKLICLLIAVSVLAILAVQPALAADYNYGEALQKAILFYEFQRAGDLPEDELRNNWRGDSVLNDGSDVGLDLSKGWFDAGDHVKFNLPMAYTVTMLSWAAYEYPEALEDSGQMEYLKREVKWATDYLINCHPEPNVFYYQVGDGTADHAWWGPAEAVEAEMQNANSPMQERPSFKVTTSSPGSTVVGEAAAAMASASILFKDSDPAYSEELLSHAKDLFEFADATRSDEGYTAAANFYDSWSGFYDELSWAATWLYLATGESEYIDKAESYVDNWETEERQDVLKYKWGHCWDQKAFGTQLLLARITEKDLYIESMERHLDWWSTGYDGDRITYTPGGLAWLDTWGALRYATTTAFLASVYADWEGGTFNKKEVYRDFAKSQVDFALGSSGRSYVVGFGENPPKRPHHRTAHGSWADLQEIPDYHRNTLYGALVGGPDAGGDYEDDIGNYYTNEVACDYNAGFVGALTSIYDDYGGNPIPDFKAIEEKTEEEYFVEAAASTSGTNSTTLETFLNNKSAWPAKAADKLSFRYFMDFSEVIEAGYSPEDINIGTNYNQADAEVSGPHLWDEENNYYYIEADFTGEYIYPGGLSEYRKELQIIIEAPNNSDFWDNSNDPSFQDIESASDPIMTEHIAVYDDGELIYGIEPGEGDDDTGDNGDDDGSDDGDDDDQDEVLKGDLNSDGYIDSIDITLIRRYLSGSTENIDTDAADMNNDTAIDSLDYALLRRKLLGR